jgi:PncC family amidohydrolase
VIPGASSGLAAAVAALLRQRGQTLAVAESSAGGLINAALVAVPGASAYYLGGAIIYTPKGRAGLLGLTREDVGEVRSATEAFALLLARRVRANLGATWGLGETGASGPTGNRYGDAPGHACIAVAGPMEAAITIETGSAEREANMALFTRTALEFLQNAIRGQTPNSRSTVPGPADSAS